MKSHYLLSFCLAAAAVCNGMAAETADEFHATTDIVGRRADGIQTPVNQIVTPAGKLIELPGIRPNALALSPDGRLLVTSGRSNELVVLNPETGAIVQHVPFPSDKAPTAGPVSPTILHPNKNAQLSLTGLAFSPDGTRIYLANVYGDIKVFTVDKNKSVSPLISWALPAVNAEGRAAEIPTGIAVSADGKKVYVVLNLSNRLGEFDAATGHVLRLWNAGLAPFDVALAGAKAYVSNLGGRLPGPDDRTGPAGRGTLARVDARGIGSEGSVSVIDLGNNSTGANKEIKIQNAQAEVLTGLRAGALAVSPNGRWLVVANTDSDSLSILDTRTDKVVETISARQNPADLFGAQPNALAFDKSGKTLFVCNGTQNAVAVFHFEPGNSKWLGLIPVGWYPAAVAHDARRNALYVANLKDLSPGRERASNKKIEFNTGLYYGSISLVPVPKTKALADYTKTALANLRYPLLAQAKLPARPNVAARPVPERVGEPSVFRHVVYILKENCAYDQVLGDVNTGNGDAELCVFGEHVTPNQHKLVREFSLLDNTYCCGILSADGHEWSMTSIATDYLERSFAGWPRSYPAGNRLEERDALAYSPAGFIWDNALSHGKKVRDFGEFALTQVQWKNKKKKDEPTFLDCYRDIVGGSNSISYSSEGNVDALRPCVETNTVGWNLNVPDIFRARQFIRCLKDWEQNDSFPDLVILWLPQDHTSGTRYGSPTPAAHVADNDLAFGQVVEALTHSKFWKETCIFAIEDDPQNGWDHVSGYRTTAYVASPYTKRGTVIHTQYNQTSVIRTMELILGLPPMNQMDATATPMFDCFTNVADLTAFTSLTNNVPLDQMNPKPKKVADRQLRKDALVSAHLPLDQEDKCPEDLFRHIIWRAMKGSQAPYPDWAAVKVADDD